METDCRKYFLSTSFILFIAWTISCSGRPGGYKGTTSKPATPEAGDYPVLMMKMLSPEENAEYKLKEPVRVSVAPDRDQKSFDSVKVFFDGKAVTTMRSEPWECSVPSGMTTMTGRKSVKAVAYSKSKIQTLTRFVIIYSDVKPKRYSYRLVHTYPHDPEAFTQGLFYDEGVLFEGTGQEAGSSLREVELETGKVLRQHNLDPSLFGEGITLYRNRIYQVTWTNKVGFVYDKSTFSVINKIFYPTQGWGLATMNDMIVMSDGTNILYFYEPEMFTAVSRLEVYDNERQVDQLNELEYIEGEIWANIWQSDQIARIDPVSGKVNSYIDLSAIFPEAARRENNADVLNGIAYDLQGKRIFVTGKRWPKLYEIRIAE